MSERRGLGPVMTWTFVVLMLALAATCVWLGSWQMQRLAEKDALIAAVAARLNADPIPVPPADQWNSLDLEALNFLPVALTGTFRYNQTVTVFTSLANARGPASGPGYWVVTPFVLAEGGTVFVNRGFIPEDFQEAAVTDPQGEDGLVTISGLLRPGEAAGFMTPGPNTSDRIEWVRDPERLAAMVDPALAPFAPFYVDLPAGPAGELPQGGETVVEFPNNHLGYAYTWYGFAIVAVVMLGFWLARQRAASKG
ncbi:MAG: SURF1 family protein [Alphaproteobacteria bacterium]|nr:SURF1 family protein [Alphaproteobacteria bacterium]MBU1562736.1 SURF1 family protein [Alphaproteobacteria bacterium]MBU2303492.1 SURF1 family protein [Alphaproteobacteria bacterium]MBU2367017.1 SURF1 family protein [Alphaproteobacteria bacterium]